MSGYNPIVFDFDVFKKLFLAGGNAGQEYKALENE